MSSNPDEPDTPDRAGPPVEPAAPPADAPAADAPPTPPPLPADAAGYPPPYPPPADATGYPPAEPAPAKRPPLWGGLLTGFGLLIVAIPVMVAMFPIAYTARLTSAAVLAILLAPYIVLLVGSALLMISRRWRRFATGMLIMIAAAWLVVIGPCIGLSMGV